MESDLRKIRSRTQVKEALWPQVVWKEKLWSFAIPLMIGLAVSLLLLVPGLPEVKRREAAATEFSAERAMVHMKAIAGKPHPVGSAGHVEVMNYLYGQLKEMAVRPEIQQTTFVSRRWGMPLRASNVKNILGRIEGAGNGKVILLTAHYDTAPNSPGANDNTTGVAAILETVRAIKAGPRLKNDVICLFTDAEEIGLIGAEAFLTEHAWAREVGAVLNFEARGRSGPVVMFETSEANGQLIAHLAKASSRLVANSLSQDIYRLLPNDTDLTIFKEAGLAGYNFAHAGGSAYYHTLADSLENYDERVLQQHGEHALQVTRYLGDDDLDLFAETNSVYFDLIGLLLIRYPYSLVWPLVLVIAAACGVVIYLGVRRGRLQIKKLLLGWLVCLSTLVSAYLGATLIWTLVSSVHPEYRLMMLGDPYNSDSYKLAITALTLTLTSSIYCLFTGRISLENLAGGCLLWWLMLAFLATAEIPGGSFLFLWPAIFGGIVLALAVSRKTDGEGGFSNRLLPLLLLIPALVILVPTIKLFYTAVTLAFSGPVMALVALSFGMILIPLGSTVNEKIWRWGHLGSLLALACVLAALLHSGFNQSEKQPSTIFYAVNSDRGEGIWGSTDEIFDDWTKQFFPAVVERGKLPEFFPMSSHTFLKSGPQQSNEPGPVLKVLEESSSAGVRKLRLYAGSERKAAILSIYEESDAELIRVFINGKPTRIGNPVGPDGSRAIWGAQIYAIDTEGVELTLEVRATQPLKFRLVDQTYGLPALEEAGRQPRPNYLMPSISTFTDTVFVSRTYTL